MKASRILEAMSVDPEIARSAIRVSFGPNTSEADIDRFVTEWRRLSARAEAA
jgi:cysteine desulfurase